MGGFAGADGNGTFGSQITIYVDGVENTTIHTSCSQEIGPGFESGDFMVLAGASRHGGALCPLPGECDVTGTGSLKFGNDNVEWELTNTGSETVTLERLDLVWPSANGDLEKIKLDGKKIYDDPLMPPAAIIDSGWAG